ncbi:Ohr family peroxiredoxin [Falsiroseomonas sp.]|uniref:Ohr family peroxiredoxin n=1 Tax=Falsiroseomonas sp. TaxID=2870721 RepID=UPI00356AA2BB
MKSLHTAIVMARGGREGFVKSVNGVPRMRMVMPRALGGPGEAFGTNPEELFAAGYAACFESSLRLEARRRGIALNDMSVVAEVTIGKDGEGYALSTVIVGYLPGLEQADAEVLMQAAHATCPYSKAIRGNLSVTLRTETSAPPQPDGLHPASADSAIG